MLFSTKHGCNKIGTEEKKQKQYVPTKRYPLLDRYNLVFSNIEFRLGSSGRNKKFKGIIPPENKNKNPSFGAV